MGNVRGYVAKLPQAENKCIVSIRGSITTINWLRDFEFWHTPWPNWDSANQSICQGCQVHTGVAKCYSELREDMMKYIKELECHNIVLSGHSLGGAIVSLASMDLRTLGFSVDTVYTYGKLRVGNDSYVSAYIAAAERQNAQPAMW